MLYNTCKNVLEITNLNVKDILDKKLQNILTDLV